MSPSVVSRRTNAKLTAWSVVNDILCGRFTGMSARITRTSAIFIGLLGVDLEAAADLCPAEARRIEEGEIQRRLAVDQPLGDVAPGRRRMLEAVTAEADGHEQA